MIVRLFAICLGLPLLVGCASGSAVQAWSDGRLPEGPRAYHIKADALGPGARAEAVSAVRSALSGDGWRETNDRESWGVAVTYSVRPMAVGAYSDESARRETWVLPPSSAHFWSRDRDVHVLNLTLSRPQDGIHDISAGAAKRAGRAARQDILQDLARTAVSRLRGAPL